MNPYCKALPLNLVFTVKSVGPNTHAYSCTLSSYLSLIYPSPLNIELSDGFPITAAVRG